MSFSNSSIPTNWNQLHFNEPPTPKQTSSRDSSTSTPLNLQPSRHIKTLDDKLVERTKVQAGVAAGKVMRISEGRHSGLLCEVVRLEPREEGR